MKKYLLILFLITITLILGYSISNSDQEENQSKIAQTVIRDIISFLPSNTDRICVMEIDLSNAKSLNRMPLNLHGVDSRIVMDKSMCIPQSSGRRNGQTIMYLYNMGPTIANMSKPSDDKQQKALERALAYVKAGHILVGAALDNCGSDVHVYAFNMGGSSPKLIETLVLAPLECSTEMKGENL